MNLAKALFIVLIVSLITACSKSEYDKFIGIYQYASPFDGAPTFIEIVKEGDDYFLLEKNQKHVAEKIDGKLKVKKIAIALSEESSALIFQGIEAKRISSEEREKVLNAIKMSKQKCKDLDLEAKSMKQKLTDRKEWNDYVEELHKRKPKGCILRNDNKGF